MGFRSIVILALVAAALAEEAPKGSKLFKRQADFDTDAELMMEESIPRQRVTNTLSNADLQQEHYYQSMQQQQQQQVQSSPQFLSQQFTGQSPFEVRSAQRPIQSNVQRFNYNPSVVNNVVSNKPANSQLLRVTVAKQPILARLPDNATLIRPYIDDSFDCQGRKYGYYADVANECQVFHVCVPLKEIHAADAAVARVPDVTYHFSFICNKYTIFSQDSLTCAWTKEALPCSEAESFRQQHDYEWFKIPAKKQSPGGNIYYPTP